MKKTALVLAVGLLSLSTAVNSLGAVFTGDYTFDTANTDVPAANNGITFGQLTGNGAIKAGSWSSSSQRYNTSGWPTTSSATDYLGFVLTPAPAQAGYSLTSLSFQVTPLKHMATAANSGRWEISSGTSTASGYFTVPAEGTTSTISTEPAFNFAFSSDVTLRFFALGTAGASGEMAFDNISLGGVSPVPEPVNVALGVFGGLFALAGLVRTKRVRRFFYGL